jgi:molybdopterin converting factor small subunit
VNVEVRCYGEVAAAVGEDASPSLDAGATVEDVLAAVGVAETAFSGGLVVLVNGRHASTDDPVADGDVVALSQSPMRE